MEWTVHARATANPTKTWGGKILAIHDGAGTADATQVKYITFAVLHISDISHLEFEVVLNGTGTSQALRLLASSSDAADIRATRAIVTKA